AVDYVLQACEALAEAHSYGIIHRDLKPANLFLTRRPDGSALIKILDFGISKDLLADMEAPASLTASQSLIGSPHYMSPEQVRHPKLVDSRSDVWALGVILHELIVGERPFAGDTPMSVLAAVVSDAPVKLRSLRREAPAELENVVLRCLEKDPARRFANVAELARALEPWATPASRPLVARIEGIVRTASGSTPPELRPISSSPRFETSETLPSPRYVNSTLQTGTLPPSTPAPAPRRALWLWGAAALGAVGGVIYVLRSSHSTRPTATTVTTATLVGASDSASSLASNAPHAEEPRVELAPPSGASSGVIAPSATVTSEPAARVVSRPGGHKGRPRATGAPASSGAPVNSSSPAGPSAQASSRPAASASAKPGAGDTDILSERR
ncbi:MAG TPA: serine/threonine-protein kinase, partial [Polyangiaceae bacterium]|nr:serine/threonine-protein kinase [Polyangiaceae bacterium]